MNTVNQDQLLLSNVMIEMSEVREQLKNIALSIKDNEEPMTHCYNYFVDNPTAVFVIVDIIAEIDEHGIDDHHAYYSACIFALDVGVAQLQAAYENGHKQAGKEINQLMSLLADKINAKKHTLLFWLPILNAFYDVHIELSPTLKAAYLNLVEEEEEVDNDGVSYIHSIRDLIQELSDLSVFDIAEHFFAQSYAMPPEFFSDLLFDLFSIDEGQDIGLLALAHPEPAVRDVVVTTLESLLADVTLSSSSLSRLKAIMHWYPHVYQDQFEHWIREQRLKEVVFQQYQPAQIVKVSASEIDGGGAQGLFLHIKRGSKHRMCGLLLKQANGIKDVWVTPYLSLTEMKHYHQEVFSDSVIVREVDLDYFKMVTHHFLAVTLAHDQMPDLHLLEIQEEINHFFIPESIDVASTIEHLAVLIEPFTPDVVKKALMRSKSWFKNKPFAGAWFVENAQVDKIVNRYSVYEAGVKTCRYEDAIRAVFENEFESQRSRWLFHFLWVSLWLKARCRKNEKLWQEIFLVAYAIYTDCPLSEIPIMQVICHHTVMNSVETMQTRRTHLS